MLIAEELLLLRLDPDRGLLPRNGQYLSVCLAGALIGELELASLVRLSDGGYLVTGPAPADPMLEQVHGVLAGLDYYPAAEQLRQVDRQLPGLCLRLAEELARRGVLGGPGERLTYQEWRRYRAVNGYPLLDPSARYEPLRRVQLAAAGDGALDGRTATLLALARWARLLKVVAPQRNGRRHARQRIRQAAELTPIVGTVRRVVLRMGLQEFGRYGP